MNITDVRIRKVGEEGKMKAIASVTFDDEFVVHDIKVIEGRNGLFIAMPSRKMSDGDFRDIAHPLLSETRNRIKDAILKEELTEGAPLPSIRSFANELKVSVLTIRRVYDELEKEGFVTSQIGVGTFVSAGNVELLRESKRRLVEEKMQEMITLAKTLSISKEELIAMMDILYEEG